MVQTVLISFFSEFARTLARQTDIQTVQIQKAALNVHEFSDRGVHQTEPGEILQ